MNRKGKRKMSEQNGSVFNELTTLHIDESIDTLVIERATTSHDWVIPISYEARSGQKTYYLKITPKGITLV